MLRVAVDVPHRTRLDDGTVVHDQYTVADIFHETEIVGDEEQRQIQFVAQVEEQVHDLRLNRHVERRDGFIGNDQLGFESEGAGDADALALSAREFMGIAVEGRSRQADPVEQLIGTAAPFLG